MDTKFWAGLLQAILITMLPPLISMGVAALFAWMKKSWTEFKVKKGELAYQLEWVARLAVQAAEQAKLAGFITEKKKYAIEFVTKYLADHGVPINVELIDVAIEAAVYAEITKQKQLPQG